MKFKESVVSTRASLLKSLLFWMQEPPIVA